MVHSPLLTDLFSSYPLVQNSHLANHCHLDNMSSKSSCNGTDKISKKRKQEYQYPLTDYYSPNQQQKTQLLYQQHHSLNLTYQQQQQQQQQQMMLNQADWTDYVRSNPSTPTNSPPPNTDTTTNNCGSSNGALNGSMNLHDYLMTDNLTGNLTLSAPDNSFGLEALYNSYIGTSIPMSTTSEFSAVNFYDDVNNTSNSIMSDQHHQVDNNPVSICVDANENESRKNSVNGISYNSNHQTLDQLAAAALLVDSRNDKSPEQIAYGVGTISSTNEESIRHNRNRPNLMPLNITSATAQSSVYRLGDFSFTDSIASSPSPAVTMPPTPVFFEPEFLDGVTNTMAEGFTFGINPTLTSTTEQLLDNNSISVSRSRSYDSISTSSQQSTIFNSEKIIENPPTVTPTAITINQPNFAPILSQTPSTIGLETDYFNSKQQQQQQQHHHHRQQNQCDHNDKDTSRRTRSRTLSNPPNIKVEPRTPALSPPESPGASVSSSSSSPPSPSPPQTPNYIRRMSISPTIMEEEEETAVGSNSNTTNQVPLVTSSHYVNVNSTVNPRSTTINVMKSIIQQYLSSSNPAALGEKTVMVLTSKVAQKSYGTEKRCVIIFFFKKKKIKKK
jgi:hypothetical protein